MATRALRVIISGDAKGALKAFGEVDAAAAKSHGKLGAAAKTAGVAAAAGVAVIGAVAVKSADTYEKVGKEVLKFQRMTGTTAEQASRMRVAFKLAGVDTENAAKSLGIFSKNLVAGKLDGFNRSLAGNATNAKKVTATTEALAKAHEVLAKAQSGHGKNAAETIRKAMENVAKIQAKLTALQGSGANAIGTLGFKTRDATGHLLPMHDILLKTADVFQKMKNGPEKTALAMQLFGKAGKDMIPFLNRGAAGIKELEKQSDKYGETLGNKDLNAVKESIKQHRLFALGMEGLQIQIGRYVLPILDKLVKFMADNLPKAIEFVRGVMAKIGPTVVGFTKPIVEFFQKNPRALFVALAVAVGLVAVAVIAAASPVTLIIAGLALLAAGVAYAYTHFKTFRTVIDGVRAWLVKTVWPAIQKVATGISTAFGALAQLVHKHWAAIQQIIGIALAAIRGYIRIAVAFYTALWRTFGATLINLVKAVWTFISNYIHGGLNVIAGIIRLVMAIIRGDWGKAWAAIKQIVSGVWQQIKAVISGALAAVRAAISVAWGAVRLITAGAWGAIRGVISGAWSGIKSTVSNAVGWVRGRVGAAFAGILSTAKAVWGSIGRVIRGGVNVAIGAINFLIRGLNAVAKILPGVDFNIKTIPKLAAGGAIPSRQVGSGFVTNGPRAIVGEGNRAHPEFVIPTDPMYRTRARGLLGEAQKRLYADGGVLPGGGNERGLNPSFLGALQAMFRDNHNLTLVSGYRSRQQQEVLYAKYLNGTGNLAARPGSSNHESGLAADIGPSSQYGWLAANVAKYHLGLPVHGEPWHVELTGGIKGALAGSLMGGSNNVVGDLAGALRKGVVMAAFAGPNALADAAIGHIPWKFLRGMVKSLKDRVYNWVKGEDGKLPDNTGSALGGSVGSAISANFSGPASGSLLSRVMAAIRQHESGGNYRAHNPGGADGAYQVLPSTWRGYAGFRSAGQAPPAIQDRFAANAMGPILAQYRNDPGAVAAYWYTGDPRRAGDPNIPAAYAGNTQSVQGYANYIRALSGHIAGVAGYAQGGQIFHTGGVFHAPRPGGEGYALLRDGERVSHRGGDGVTVIVNGSVLSERQLVDVIARAQRRGVLAR